MKRLVLPENEIIPRLQKSRLGRHLGAQELTQMITCF